MEVHKPARNGKQFRIWPATGRQMRRDGELTSRTGMIALRTTVSKSYPVVGKENEALEGTEYEVNSDWQGQRFLFIDPVCQSHSLKGVFEPQNQDLNQVRIIHG